MRALILSADRFEDSELTVPCTRLREEGVETDITNIGSIKGLGTRQERNRGRALRLLDHGVPAAAGAGDLDTARGARRSAPPGSPADAGVQAAPATRPVPVRSRRGS